MRSRINQWGTDLSLGLLALVVYILGIPWLKGRVTDFIHDPENPLIQILSLVPGDVLVEINRVLISVLPKGSRPLVEAVLREIMDSIDSGGDQVHDDEDDGQEGPAPSLDHR